MKRLYAIVIGGFLLCFTPAAKAQTAQEYQEMGHRYIKQKDYPRAITAYQKAVAQDAGLEDAWYNLGWCFNETQQYAAAAEALLQAKQLNGTDYNVHRELGYAFTKLQKWADAEQMYTKALALNPKDVLALMEMGNFQRRILKQPQKAAGYYQTGLEIDSLNRGCNFGMAYLRIDELRYYEALTYLDRCLQKNPLDTEALYEKSYAWYQMKDADQTEKYLQQLIAIQPKNVAALNLLGAVNRLLRQPRRCEDATNWYKKTLSIQPTNADANYGIGWCLNEQKRYTEAQTYFEVALRYQPNHRQALTELGYCLIQQKQYNAALVHLMKALQLAPNDAITLYFTGLGYCGLNDKTNALRIYQKLQPLNTDLGTKLISKINSITTQAKIQF